MTMQKEKIIDPMWILCDNESTIDITENPKMLTNLRNLKRPIELTGIGGGDGSIKIQQEGDLSGYGKVYFHQDVVANILSFFNLTKQFRSVRYDNQVKDAFIVTRDDGSRMEFVPSAEGLYHYNFEHSIKLAMKKKEKPSNTMMA
jgi:hypothetical protein